MIVIATNNTCVGRVCRGNYLFIDNFLERLLLSIERTGYNKDVLVIDTGTKDEKSLSYLESLKNSKFPFNIIVDKTHSQNYSTGAYLHAFENYFSDYYIFIQDSIEIKDKSFIEKIEDTITDNNVVCWVKGIGIGIDNEEQKNFIKNCIGYDYIIGQDQLIFGPIFFIKRNTFSKVIEQIKLKPICKNEDSGMERALGALFNRNGIEILSIDNNYDFDLMINDRFKYLTKHHADRK